MLPLFVLGVFAGIGLAQLSIMAFLKPAPLVQVAEAPAIAPHDSQTRVGQLLSQKDDHKFVSSFLELSNEEQAEIIQLLTSELSGWEAHEKLPFLLLENPTAFQPKLKKSLSEWLLSARKGDQKFVEIAETPVRAKLRFEKTELCEAHRESADFLERIQKYLSFGSAAAEPVPCHPQVQVALVLDGGEAGLWEEELLRENPPVLALLDGLTSWNILQHKVLEALERLNTRTGAYARNLPERLRLLDLLGKGLDRRSFLNRRGLAVFARVMRGKDSNPCAILSSYYRVIPGGGAGLPAVCSAEHAASLR
jgi:hypothetical protein